MSSTHPPSSNILEWPPSPSGSHAELMTVMPSPPEKKNPVKPSVTRVDRFDEEHGHGVVTVASQEGWVSMMQQRCAELGSDALIMRERALKANEKVKQMNRETREMNRLMRTIRTSLHESGLACREKDKALRSAEQSIDMLEQENNELKKDVVRTNRLLAWYRNKKNQEASPKQSTVREECESEKKKSLSNPTVIATAVHKRRVKEQEDTKRIMRNEQDRISRTTLSRKDEDLVATPTPEIPTFSCAVDKEHVLERDDKPGVAVAAVTLKDIKEALKKREDKFNELLIASGSVNEQELLQCVSEVQNMEKLRYEYKELLTSVGAVSSKDLLRHISDSQNLIDAQGKELESLKNQYLGEKLMCEEARRQYRILHLKQTDDHQYDS